MIIDYLNQFNNLALGYPKVKDKVLTNLDDIHNALDSIYVKRFLSTHEYFYAILLDQNDRVIKVSKISSDEGQKLDIDIEKLYELLKTDRPHSLIVSHNHPSQKLKPSLQDEKFTSFLDYMCRKLGIKLKDHLIYSKRGVYSFNRSGLLPM